MEGHPSNGQNTMAAQLAAANSAIANAANARAKAQKKAQDTAKTKQLNDSISAIQSYQLAPAITAVKEAEKQVNTYQSALDAYKRAHYTEPGFPSGADTAAINAINSYLAPAKAALAVQKTKVNDFNSTIVKLKKQLTDLNPLFFPTSKKPVVTTTTNGAPTSLAKGTYLNGDGKKKAFSKDYKYNAPMVKEAYFGATTLQGNVLGGNRVDQGAYADARQAWEGVNGGRGTIQMDKKVLQTMEPQLNTQSEKLDLQKYGFKFLYNPTTVSMAWGLVNYMDPPYEAAGKDAFAPVSAGLMTSTVDFELILNRIEDFNYLDENGLIATTNTVTNGTNYITQRSSINPYSVTVPDGDLKSIYRKGTMYDMEYLMKTLNGPSATFKSDLNGTTSDRSWLRPTIVELHLGSAMRYRVRIANLSINHIMFNSRMVPILSSVKITCSRFNDGPSAMPTSSVVTGTQHPGANLSTLRNTVPGYGR